MLSSKGSRFGMRRAGWLRGTKLFKMSTASVKGFCLKAYRYLKFLQSVPVKVCLVLVRLRFWPRSASMKLKTKTSTRFRKSNTATADVLRCVNIRCRRAGMSRYSPT